jgi:hypothetical protein
LSDIFREIDEELRRDNFFKLWQRYGKYVVALAVAAVAVTALVVGWREYQSRERQAEGVRYAAALDLARQGKDKDAADAFAAMAQSVKGGRAVLARLEEAALRAKSGDSDGALAIYDAIAQNGAAEQTYRDLANLLAARLLVDKAPKDAEQRLLPLTDANNPWHATALELTAIAALKEGNKTEARATYQRLADDLGAPQGLRARAAEMVAALAQ